MDLQLKGLRAVVTGGSNGIGAAIVKILAAEGCNVAFCARNRARIDRTLTSLQGLPGHIEAAAVDVCQRADLAEWLAGLGHFDIFIANVSALSLDWADALRVDLQATIDCVELAVPYLQQSRHGALTYIGSKASSLSAPTSAPYGAAKAAMAHYMRSQATRLLPQVRVNVVSPGDTLANDGIWGRVQQNDPTLFSQIVARNPLGRLASADEIARVVAFVSSPAASFVAGANWYVDGGSTSHVQI
jgi:NAD(P)-dependent dehydrogenase (short-subunit alcohol dehydrogenase family)